MTTPYPNPVPTALNSFSSASSKHTDMWSKMSCTTAGTRCCCAAGIAVVTAIVLFIARPPMIRDRSDVSYRHGKISFVKISIWSLIAFIVSFALMNYL